MTATAPHIDDAAISEAAYFIWLNEGCPDGKSQDHWARARAALQTAPAAPKRTRKAAAPKSAPAKAPAKPRAPRKAKAAD